MSITAGNLLEIPNQTIYLISSKGSTVVLSGARGNLMSVNSIQLVCPYAGFYTPFKFM